MSYKWNENKTIIEITNDSGETKTFKPFEETCSDGLFTCAGCYAEDKDESFCFCHIDSKNIPETCSNILGGDFKLKEYTPRDNTRNRVYISFTMLNGEGENPHDYNATCLKIEDLIRFLFEEGKRIVSVDEIEFNTTSSNWFKRQIKSALKSCKLLKK